MRRHGTHPDLWESFVAGRKELAAYLVAGAVYIAIGVQVPEFLFSLFTAIGYVLLCLVVIPKVLRLLR